MDTPPNTPARPQIVQVRPKFSFTWFSLEPNGSYTTHCLRIPAKFPTELVTDPHAYAHWAARMRRFDEVRVVSEDAAYYAHLLVISVQGPIVGVRMLVESKGRGIEIPDDTPPLATDTDLPRIEFNKGSGYRIRGADGSIVASGLESKEKAKVALDQYLVTLAASVAAR